MCTKPYLSRAFTPVCVSSIRVVNELSKVEYIWSSYLFTIQYFFFSQTRSKVELITKQYYIFKFGSFAYWASLSLFTNISLTYHFLIYSKIMIAYIVKGSATLRPRSTLTWKKKKIYIYIYNNLKFFICLPFKKNLETPSVYFMPIKLNFVP